MRPDKLADSTSDKPKMHPQTTPIKTEDDNTNCTWARVSIKGRWPEGLCNLLDKFITSIREKATAKHNAPPRRANIGNFKIHSMEPKALPRITKHEIEAPIIAKEQYDK